MKKLLIIPGLLAAIAAAVSCTTASYNGTQPVADKEFTVDSAMADAVSLVDSVIAIKGQCVHICDYQAYNAYIMGSDSNLIRCVATPNIGGYFPDSLENHEVVFEGMLRDQHLNIEDIHNLDEQYRMHVQILRDYNLDNDTMMLDSHRRCEYERRYRGQSGVKYFGESTREYRKSIEDRAAAEGKDFLTFYYLEVTGYKILD